MSTARFPIRAVGLTAMLAMGLAGQATAQQSVIPPPQPWSARAFCLDAGARCCARPGSYERLR